MAKEVKRTKGYLYSIWRDYLKIYEGEAITLEYINENHRRIKPRRVSLFVMNNGKKFGCSEEPGVVFNKMVWLTEKNDDIGRDLLIEYERLCIERLKEKIYGHRHTIEILKKES